ncbi:MAG: CinA family protein [Actinomycetes bacterium]
MTNPVEEALLGAAATLVPRLAAAGLTVATAESLTGGLLATTVTEVAGASVVFRGGVVAYATELKTQLLGVDPDLLRQTGPVDPGVATQMAVGVRDRLGATFGVATTGVAGPDGQDGHPVGEVYVAVAGPHRVVVERHAFSGSRSQIRAATVAAALVALGAESAG